MQSPQEFIDKKKLDKYERILFIIFSILFFIFLLFIIIFLNVTGANFFTRILTITIPLFFLVLILFFWILWIINRPILIITRLTLQNKNAELIYLNKIKDIKFNDMNEKIIELILENGDKMKLILPNGLLSLAKIYQITQNELFLINKS